MPADRRIRGLRTDADRLPALGLPCLRSGPFGYAVWDAVANLTVPTLVIAGDEDRLTPPAHTRWIPEQLPVPAVSGSEA